MNEKEQAVRSVITGTFISENGTLSRNGIQIPNPFQSGYMNGYGVFETIFVKKGQILFLKEHWSRMQDGALAIKLPPPPEFTVIEKWCQEYVAALSQEVSERFTGKLRMNYVKKGCAGGDIHIYGEEFTYPMDWYRKGIRSGVCSERFVAHGDPIKTLSYLEHLLFRIRSMDAGFQEAVLLTDEGVLAEGTVSNLFFVSGGVLYTPELELGILPGIVRDWVRSFAEGQGCSVQKGRYGLEMLEKAEGIFFTNSLMGIMPVSEFGGRSVGTLENAVYKMIKENYNGINE